MKKNYNYLRTMCNAIRSNADSTYQNAVPFLNEGDSIAELKNPLFSNELVYNTFYNGLTNMISLTVFKSRAMYKNPLEILKKGNNELGVDIREIAEDLLDEHNYELSDDLLADVLKLDAPVVFECIHRLNRKSYFKISISESELELALNSWEDFDRMFVRKTDILYNSNFVREFEWCKELLRSTVQKGYVPTVEVDEVVDETTGKKMVKTVKNTVADFRFVSTEHTMLNKVTNGEKTIKVWTEPKDTVFVTSAKTMNNIDTDVLSVAFNVDKLALKTDIVLEVDDMGYYRINTGTVEEPVYKYYHIEGMVFDKHFTQIYDKKISFWAMPIASAMIEQRYLHVWQTYSCSPFCNVRALVREVSENDIPTGYEFDYVLESTNDAKPVIVEV